MNMCPHQTTYRYPQVLLLHLYNSVKQFSEIHVKCNGSRNSSVSVHAFSSYCIGLAWARTVLHLNFYGYGLVHCHKKHLADLCICISGPVSIASSPQADLYDVGCIKSLPIFFKPGQVSVICWRRLFLCRERSCCLRFFSNIANLFFSSLALPHRKRGITAV